jgi:hypothetical protein
MHNDNDGEWVGSDYLDLMFVLGGMIMIMALTMVAYYLW